MSPSGRVIWTVRGRRGEYLQVSRPAKGDYPAVVVLSVAGVAPTWWAYRSTWRALLDAMTVSMGGWPARWDYEARTMRERTEQGDLVRRQAALILEP